MPTYAATLTDGSILKTVAPSRKKARANIAHRLSYSMGHKRAYGYIQSVVRSPSPDFMPTNRHNKPRCNPHPANGNRLLGSGIPTQGVLDL